MLLLLLACTERVPPPGEAHSGDPGKAWGKLLREAATENGVDYALLEERKETLEAYVSWISMHGPFTDKMRVRQEDDKIAFYINAYNALVVYGVLEHIPIDSVQSIGDSLVPIDGWGFFYQRMHLVDGEWTSLFYLEEQALLGTFQEPLIHGALNCASQGCPQLRYWRGSDLKSRLKQGMRKLANSERGSRQTETGWAVSELFHWNERDFTDWSDAENLCQYLESYGKGDFKDWLAENSQGCPLESFPFDWSLNERAKEPPGRSE
jgi:hypothetical protein